MTTEAASKITNHRIWAIAYALSFTISGTWIFVVLLRHFCGAPYLLDSGLLAELAWHNLAATSAHTQAGGSYYATHFSPIFTLSSLVSYLLPLTQTEYFSLLIASIYGFAALLFLKSMRMSTLVDTPLKIGIAAVLGVCFSLCHIMLTTVFYPHFEQAIPVVIGFVLLFLVFDHKPTWQVWTLAALVASIREDAALHLALALMALLAINRFSKDIALDEKHVLKLVGACLLYYVFTLVVPGYFFGRESSVTRVYIGSPPFSHLSWQVLEVRARNFLETKKSTYLPLILVIGIAIRKKKPLILAGYLSCVPWFLLQIMAVMNSASLFGDHYQFPFFVGITWAIMYLGYEGSRHNIRGILTISALLIVLGCEEEDFRRLTDLRGFSPAVVSATRRMTKSLATKLPNTFTTQDAALVAIMPQRFAKIDYIGANARAKKPEIAIFSMCNVLDRNVILALLEREQFSNFMHPRHTQFWVGYKERSSLNRLELSNDADFVTMAPAELFSKVACGLP